MAFEISVLLNTAIASIPHIPPITTLAPLPFVPVLVGHDGGNDDHAFDDVDVENIDPKEGETRGEDSQDQHPYDGPGDPPDPAEKRGAADDDRRDRVELPHQTGARLRCQRARDLNNRCRPVEHASHAKIAVLRMRVQT